MGMRRRSRVAYKSTEEDIDTGDERLGEQHGLPEVHWMAHLGQEGDEHDSSGVSI